MSKHEDIIKYISELKTGTKISVRAIANALGVSDGTAYRAIKDAEVLGVVSTIPRVGTIKIEKVQKKHFDSLTFAEVVNIVEGTVLGGKNGLHKTLNKFVIGAMTIHEMKNYVSDGNLLIVGDREEAHRMALENGSAILITGGFKCSEDIKALANYKEMPIISCSYDTFSTATMLNKAISENLIKKDIILVEDIMNTDVSCIHTGSTIRELREIMRTTGHGRIPVLNENEKLVGVITAKEIADDLDDNSLVGEQSFKVPVDVSRKTTVAYASHIMVSEGIELLPVIEGRRVIGVISSKDVIKALQYINKQPQIGETIDDIIIKNFTAKSENKELSFKGKITPEMLNHTGTVSWNVLTLVMSTIGTEVLRRNNNLNVSVDSFSVFYVKPVQMEAEISIKTNIFEIGKNYSKVEIEVYSEEDSELIGKALLSARIVRK